MTVLNINILTFTCNMSDKIECFQFFLLEKRKCVFMEWDDIVVRFFCIFLKSSSLYRTSLRHKRTIRARKKLDDSEKIRCRFHSFESCNVALERSRYVLYLDRRRRRRQRCRLCASLPSTITTVCKTKKIALNQQPKTPFENLILVRREMAFEEKLSEGKRNDVSHALKKRFHSLWHCTFTSQPFCRWCRLHEYYKKKKK